MVLVIKLTLWLNLSLCKLRLFPSIAIKRSFLLGIPSGACVFKKLHGVESYLDGRSLLGILSNVAFVDLAAVDEDHTIRPLYWIGAVGNYDCGYVL